MNRSARSGHPECVSADGVQGVVLYDGQCGFCSRWVKYWAGTLVRSGFEVASLDEPWVAERLRMQHEELLTDMRLLTADGQMIPEPMSIYMWRDGFGGRGPSMRFSVCQGSTS
jgi:hypothetical protein